MKEIEEALKIDNSWLYELARERDRKLMGEIMNGKPIKMAKLKPLTVQDLFPEITSTSSH